MFINNDYEFFSWQACDKITKQRGIPDEELYDDANLYHSVEFAQYDYLQRGQYGEANKMLTRMDSIIAKLDGRKNWKKTKELVWIQKRMFTRQITEAFRVNRMLHTDDRGALGSDPISDGSMNYAAISEIGIALLHVFQHAMLCAEREEGTSCLDDTFISAAVNRSEMLKENVINRESILEYTKGMVDMLHQVLLGIIELAEFVRPHGFQCYLKKNCNKQIGKKKWQKIVNGPLKKATEIQKNKMIQSSATPSLLFIPSYEIYGHVLLFLGKYSEAKDMFEFSLEERMGRTLSLLGLARAHAMLGNTQQADYFYQYLRTQLQDADEDNMVLNEADSWNMGYITAETLRDNWFWPYFTHSTNTKH